MDTRKMAMEIRLNHWAQAMHERRTSGLSIRRWCRENGVGEKTYYYWQRKLREAACRELQPPEPESVETSLVPSGWAVCEPADKAKSDMLLIEIGKCRVNVTGETAPELLATVCRALASIC